MTPTRGVPGVRYGLPEACTTRVGSTSPAVVQRWFAERGVDRTHEFWRLALQGRTVAVQLPQWVEICEALELPLHALVDYAPTGRVPHLPSRRRPRRELPSLTLYRTPPPL